MTGNEDLLALDYGFRIYNPAIGKFLSVDPLTQSYPWYTPYQFAGNRPVWAIDLDGLEEAFATDVFDEKTSKYRRYFSLNPDLDARESDIGQIQFKYSDGTESEIEPASGRDLERIIEMRETFAATNAKESFKYTAGFIVPLDGPTTLERPVITITKPSPILPIESSKTKVKTPLKESKPHVINGTEVRPGELIELSAMPFEFGNHTGALGLPGSPADLIIQEFSQAIIANKSISKVTLEGSIGSRQSGLNFKDKIRLQQSMQHGIENIKKRLRELGVPDHIIISASGSNVIINRETEHNLNIKIE